MPPSPIELKEKLLEAIDEDSNIVNYDLLLEVIVLLEKVALTREDLETTRLGLYVNSVRKKASNELNKRLRKLVKSWQALCSSTPSNNASPASGYSPAISYSNSPRLASLPISVSSPHLQSRGSASPALQTNRIKRTSPALNEPVPHRLVSPLVRQVGDLDSPVPNNRRISPSNFKSSQSSTPIPFTKSSSRSDTPNGTRHRRENLGARTPTPPHANNHLNSTPNLDSTHRTHAANKKRRRSDESCTSDSSSIKKTRVIVNGESTRVAERIRTPKVKTTAEIIAELQAVNSTPLTASDTITKIVTNQIEKEEDDIHMSVVPKSALPKYRRKPVPPSTRSDLSKTKSDLVHRFLHQQQQHSSVDEDIDNTSTAYDNSCSAAYDSHTGSGETVAANTIDMSVDPYSLLPPLDYNTITWSDEEIDDGIALRNAITGEYPDGCEAASNDSNEHNNEPHIERVINDDWQGVNGTSNTNSQFHPWTETFTINKEEQEADNRHIVLPYVDI